MGRVACRRRMGGRQTLIGIGAVLAVVSCLGGGTRRASAVTGPTWWKVDTHEHSSFSGDARQDLGLLASNDKSRNYNAIFVTDHDRAASFAIEDANGNHLEYFDTLSGRWIQKKAGNPTTFSYGTVTSPVHSGT